MLGNHLAFIDSFQFMSSSLEKLANNLPDEAFRYTREVFKNHFQLMKQSCNHKEFIRYDYMDSFEKFNETELPTKKDFYSVLNDENISDYQYNHSIEVWNTFNLKTSGEYHDL